MAGEQTKVFLSEGGDRLEIKAGGKLVIDGTEWAAVLVAVPTVDPADGETIWLDNGVLKVASST